MHLHVRNESPVVYYASSKRIKTRAVIRLYLEGFSRDKLVTVVLLVHLLVLLEAAHRLIFVSSPSLEVRSEDKKHLKRVSLNSPTEAVCVGPEKYFSATSLSGGFVSYSSTHCTPRASTPSTVKQ